MAVIPIENSLAGAVNEHYNLLLSHQVVIQREFRLRIAHTLIAPPGVGLQRITRFFRIRWRCSSAGISSAVIPRSCRAFLRHGRKREAHYGERPARCRRHRRRRGRPDYGARVLRRGLEDDKQNFTRFFLIREAAGARPLPGANKTSIAFALKSLPGSYSGRSASLPYGTST